MRCKPSANERVSVDLTLVHVRHAVVVVELDRILEGDDVRPTLAVDGVDHPRHCRRLALTVRADDEDQPLGLERVLLEPRRQAELFGRGDGLDDPADRKRQRAALAVEVAAQRRRRGRSRARTRGRRPRAARLSAGAARAPRAFGPSAGRFMRTNSPSMRTEGGTPPVRCRSCPRISAIIDSNCVSGVGSPATTACVVIGRARPRSLCRVLRVQR